tara:strand:+ start:316 stop:591 length:276 start_codon:yes stop_codon:yes gene_type:complete
VRRIVTQQDARNILDILEIRDFLAKMADDWDKLPISIREMAGIYCGNIDSIYGFEFKKLKSGEYVEKLTAIEWEKRDAERNFKRQFSKGLL